MGCGINSINAMGVNLKKNNRLRVTTGEGDNGERRGRVKQRNRSRALMVTDNGGMDCGSGGWGGMSKEGKGRTTVTEQQ